MILQDWLEPITRAFAELWLQVANFLPELLGAIIVMIVGLIVAAGLERLVERVIYYLRLDNLLRQLGVEAFMERGNLKLNAGHFLGQLVYWFFIVVFLLAASDILGFSAFSDFLRDVLNYIPRVVVAGLILLAALVVARFVKHLIRVSVMGARLHAAKTLGHIAWWGVFVFGFLAALVQLGVAVQIINTLITGLVAMLALAGGLAFGLGGKEHADAWLGKLKDEMGQK